MHDVSYRNSHNHINRGALYIMGNGENFKIIPKEILILLQSKPAYFFFLDKSELWKRGNWCTNWRNESKSPLTSLYFYLKSHIFEHLQHTMEKNSTSRSGTTSNLYCLFGVTVIKLCQCWVPSQVDVTLRYSILLLPPFATTFFCHTTVTENISCHADSPWFFCFA